jgi:ubiquinone/menaquinone biosynthesis C-methylase UbiE
MSIDTKHHRHGVGHERDDNEFARRLVSDERRQYQDPLKVSKAIGVKKGMTVTDLGCGPGFFTMPLASLVGPQGRVYAVDSNPTMLKHLRDNIKKAGANGKTITIVRADTSQTRIPSHSADIVLLARLLHDIEDKKAFLSEVKRICKTGGKIADVDWKKVRMAHGPPHEIRLSVAESRKILEENGLRVTKTFDAGQYHYGLIMRL